MKYLFGLFLLVLPFCNANDCSCFTLFSDLSLVEEIDREIEDHLPYFYNSSMVVGYFAMPSARFPPCGDLAFGATSISPYYVFGANFAPFSRIELSGNYRIFRGVLEGNFGDEGFGDDADRIGNVKFGILVPEDQIPYFPSIAFGLDDFLGTKRFSSQYVVATKAWEDFGFEVSLGWGWGRMKGLFGGAAWSPFRCSEIPLLKDLTLFAEYDANDYKEHQPEHRDGRSVSSRINGGVSYLLGNTLQLTMSSVRGEKIGGSASIRFPLGSSEGLLPKVDNPPLYTSPIDTQPLGPIRPESEFVADLACSFADQGLDLYEAYLYHLPCFERMLYLKVVNNRYRKQCEVRERLQEVLASITPANIACVKVVFEADGVVSHSYSFRTCDLNAYRECCLGSWELETLSPMNESGCPVDPYEAACLFERKRKIWTFTFRPRMINFFGSTSGKFKYSFGVLTSLDGFLPGGLTYQLQASYSIYSSMHGLQSRDRLNPSPLIQVRSDTVRYYQGGRVRLEEGYLQKSWNFGKGWFFRLAGGYFEPAYGGGASELLLYPVTSNWAIGAEVATLWKREYQGLAFTNKVPKFNDRAETVYEPYLGLQYFLDLYYQFKPLDLLFKVKAGQFLAKDKGVRVEAARYFQSGARFSLWVTMTDAKDAINGRRYYDKGFAFTIPFDFFLKKSSRTLLSYGMSAWLRDVGAIGGTGATLYNTLFEDRYD